MSFECLRKIVPLILGIFFTLILAGCPSIGKDDPTAFSYEDSSIAIYNPDWDYVPVPNDLLNPVQQTSAGISVPGRSHTAPCDVCMDIRYIDEEELQKAADKGYEAPPDSELTAWLKRSLNLLNGYVPDIIPEFPFTKPVDMDTVSKFRSGENSNLEDANFFFLDITEKDKPIIIEPDEYLLAFDFALKEELPYLMTLRHPPFSTPLPEHFKQGHSYLVVMTGGEETGIKDVDGIPFEADAPFILMEGKTPYVAPDGSSRMNLLTDMECVRDLEMARQVTNYGLEIWEKLVDGKRGRDEVISAFYFSIANNPITRYFNQVPALTYKNPLIPEAADAAEYGTRAPMGFEPSFRLSRRIDAKSANKDSVKLYRKIAEGNYERVEVESIETINDDMEAKIKIHPKSPLEKGESYLVAGTGNIRGEDGLKALADIYSLLVKAPMSLIETDGWLAKKPSSPYIDIRIEALIALINLELTSDMEMTQESFNHIPRSCLDDAAQVYSMLLQQLEEIRIDYAEPIKWLYDNNEVENSDDLLLAYTFTMEGDEPTDGDVPDGDSGEFENCDLGVEIARNPITAQDMGEKSIEGADISGVFDLYAKFEYILLAEPVELFLTGEFTQTGSIEEGNAVIDGFLCVADVAMPLIEPAAIDADGNFTSFLPDFNIPTSLIDILEKDATGDVTMNGTIYNENGFAGVIEADLRGAKLVDLPEVDVTLTGDFGAMRSTERR